MLVKFRRTWYAPDGVFYPKGEQEVPDDYQPHPGKVEDLKEGVTYLPRTAKVVEQPKSKAKAEK
jgi:hypothetical protein